MQVDEFRPKWWPLLLIILAWLLLIPPLMHPYFFHTHDGGHMFERVVELNQTLDHTPFGSRWLPDLAEGYGLPVFYFYPPLFFYACAFFHLFGLSDGQTFRLVFALTLLLSGFSMYALARDRLPKLAACVSAVAYMAAPFHLVDLYTRGAPAQCLAYVFVPLVLLFTFRTLQYAKFRDITLGALCLAGLILSYHLIAYLTLMLSPLLLLVINRQKWKSALIGCVYIILLGFGLSAFYWLSMVIEGRNLQLEQIVNGFANYAGHFVFIHELFEQDWGEPNFPVPNNPLRGMMLQLGLPFVFAFAGTIILIWRMPYKKQWNTALYFLALTAVSIFFMLPISSPLWATIPYLKVTVFPWRFLFFISLAGAYLTGWVVWQLAYLRVCSLGTLGLISLVLITWYGTNCFDTEHDASLLRATPGEILASGTRASAAPGTEFVMDTIQSFPQDAYPEKIHIASGKGSIKTIKIWPTSYKADIQIEEPTNIVVDTFWFPGWQIEVNGKPHEYSIDERYGTIHFDLTPGKHAVLIKLTETWIRLMGGLITFCSIIAWIILSWSWLNIGLSKQIVLVTFFILLALIMFRSPWQSYPPILERKTFPAEDYKSDVVQAEIFSGDVWNRKGKAISSWIPADKAFNFELTVEDRIFSTRLSSSLIILESGDYEFRLQADDSAWFNISDQLVARTSQIGDNQVQGSIYLTEGMHPFLIYYHNVKDIGELDISWKEPGNLDWSKIPTNQIALPLNTEQSLVPGEEHWEKILNQENQIEK